MQQQQYYNHEGPYQVESYHQQLHGSNSHHQDQQQQPAYHQHHHQQQYQQPHQPHEQRVYHEEVIYAAPGAYQQQHQHQQHQHQGAAAVEGNGAKIVTTQVVSSSVAPQLQSYAAVRHEAREEVNALLRRWGDEIIARTKTLEHAERSNNAELQRLRYDHAQLQQRVEQERAAAERSVQELHAQLVHLPNAGLSPAAVALALEEKAGRATLDALAARLGGVADTVRAHEANYASRSEGLRALVHQALQEQAGRVRFELEAVTRRLTAAEATAAKSVATAQAATDNAVAAQRAAAQKLEETKAQAAEVDGEHARLRQRLDDMAHKVEVLNAGLEAAKADKAALEGHDKAHRGAVDALRADVFQTLDKQRAAIATLKQSGAAVTEWRERVDASWRNEERAAIEASAATRKQAEDMAAVVVTLSERLEKFMDATRRELAKQREEHDATLRAIASKLGEVEAKLEADPSADRAATNGSKKELQATLAAVKEKLAEHARNIVALRGALNDMHAPAPAGEGNTAAAAAAAAPAAAPAAFGAEKKAPQKAEPTRNIVALRAAVFQDANAPAPSADGAAAAADKKAPKAKKGAAAASAGLRSPKPDEIKKAPKPDEVKKAPAPADVEAEVAPSPNTPKPEEPAKTPKPEDFELEVAPEAGVVVA